MSDQPTLDTGLDPGELPDAPPPDTFPDAPQIALDLGVTPDWNREEGA